MTLLATVTSQTPTIPPHICTDVCTSQTQHVVLAKLSAKLATWALNCTLLLQPESCMRCVCNFLPPPLPLSQVDLEESGEGQGGYAKEMSKEFIEAEVRAGGWECVEATLMWGSSLMGDTIVALRCAHLQAARCLNQDTPTNSALCPCPPCLHAHHTHHATPHHRWPCLLSSAVRLTSSSQPPSSPARRRPCSSHQKWWTQ